MGNPDTSKMHGDSTSRGKNSSHNPENFMKK